MPKVRPSAPRTPTRLLPETKAIQKMKSSHPGVWQADGSGYPIARRPIAKAAKAK